MSSQLHLWNSNAKPFIQWAGGKRSLIKHIIEMLPDDISNYHEPFIGGGSVFLALQHRIQQTVLSDMNCDLIKTYCVIRDDIDNLIKRLEIHRQQHFTGSDYYETVRHSKPITNIDIASRFLYLNKTCYNGIYRINAAGEFYTNEDTRKKNKWLDFNYDNLLTVSEILSNVDIKHGDFCDTTRTAEGDFVYCDPTYDDTDHRYTFPKFKRKDHIHLKHFMDFMSDKNVNVMISNSNTDFILELYKDYHIETITVNNALSALRTQKMKRQELIIRNY